MNNFGGSEYYDDGDDDDDNDDDGGGRDRARQVIHWRSKGARLLTPFYGFVLHADEVAQRYYSRLIRDNMHYPEEVYCKASQVVSLIKAENSSGSFSSMHIRRCDTVIPEPRMQQLLET